VWKTKLRAICELASRGAQTGVRVLRFRFQRDEEAIVRVTIIGCGNMGRAIGTRAVAGGNEVELIDRNPKDANALAQELGERAAALGAESPFGGEVVVIALYYPSTLEAIQQYRDRLAGRVVVEISNPVDTQTWDRLATPPDSSGAEELAKLAPPGTPVVKAFNTTFATTLVAGEVAGQQLDVLVAGDDADAKRKLAELVEAGGLRPLDVGPLLRARELERLGLLHIVMQEQLGWGYSSAVKFHAP
jgi:8-hydroxy-5-deazaflavin:NADPH oxidoreductase